MCSTEHMPAALSRYRFVEFHPEYLDYPSGRVLLTFRAADDHSWALYAVKESDPTQVLEIMRRPSMLEWAEARFAGFDVATGSAADKLMRRLVQVGGAVAMGPYETYHERRKRKPPYH